MRNEDTIWEELGLKELRYNIFQKKSSLRVRSGGCVLLLVIVPDARGRDDDRERDEETHRSNEALRRALVRIDRKRARAVAIPQIAVGGRFFDDLNVIVVRSRVEWHGDVEA